VSQGIPVTGKTATLLNKGSVHNSIGGAPDDHIRDATTTNDFLVILLLIVLKIIYQVVVQ
jgi:hypothetical protein